MSLGHQQYWVDDTYDDRYADYEPLALNVEPDERVGAPLPNRFKARLRRTLAGLLLIAGAWAVVAHVGLDTVIASARSVVAEIVSNAQDIATRANQGEQPAPVAASSTLGLADPGTADPQTEQSGVVDRLPELTPAQDEEQASAADEAPSTESLGTAYEEKAEPAEEAKDNSPKRKSAVAAGLDPDLPNILLTRLNKADLQNAAYAIKTALAKTPDDASFSWPPSPSREQALFEVRFVQGAAHGCRRFIVTVTKSRWSSTSAALERCGYAHARAG